MTTKHARYGEILAPREVAQMFSVTPKTVRKWADNGDIAYIKTPGGHRRYPRWAVEELLDRLAYNPEETK